MDLLALKQQVHQQLAIALNRKVLQLQNEINSVTQSRDNETKSTAGDKHETSRAIAQNELEQLGKQMLNLEQQTIRLKSVKSIHKFDLGQNGALIRTNAAYYYLSIGHGKINVGEQVIFSLSSASPLGQQLLGKAVGDKIPFNGREFEVLAIS